MFLPFSYLFTVCKNFSQVAWGGVTETSDCPSQAAGVLVVACPEVHQVLGHCWGQWVAGVSSVSFFDGWLDDL